jgi:AcrR family transcriptional regulator
MATTTERRTVGNRPTTRTRMIETTGRLMRDQGFHATGLNQIVEEADAPKGSMYFHFPGGKVDLAVAAVESFDDSVTSYLQRLADEQATTAGAVAAFVDATARRMERSDFRSACIVAAVGLETAAVEPRLGEACAHALERWTRIIASGLRREGWPRVRADRQAQLVMAALEGAIVMTKAMRDTGPLLNLHRTLIPLLREP